MLILLGMAIVGAALWLLGPLFSFGGITPLASIGMRVTVIVMLLALLMSILLKWPFHIVGIAALCLLIWHAAPLLAVGAMFPLASSEARSWAIGAILAVYVIYGMARLYLAVKADKDFMARLFHIDRDKQPGHGVGESIKNVTAKVDQAMTQLKSMRSRSHGLLRVLEGKRYLYDLPWYVILGNSGAGKTTAIHNAGLKFPLVGYKHTAGLIEGTANCDWSFTNEAVFIDTAGRYATQGVHEDSKRNDAAEWQGFSGLLRKHRPRAPINGVVLTISVAELVADLPQRMIHAAALRKRLEELRADLGIRFPVYVMITQADLLCGFAEYFQSLTSEGRAQVWGCTLPGQDSKTGDDGDGIAAQLKAQLAQLSRRLHAGVATRLQEEFEKDRRCLLKGLPSEFDGLLESLNSMLEVLFQDSRFDNTQLRHTVRGVYFTSAAQDQAPPVAANRQTLILRLRRALDATWAAPGLQTAQITAHSYFLHDLFTKLVIPESHLVRPNLRWEFRFRMMKLTGHALCLVLFVWLAGVLSLSFAQNRDYLATVTGKAGVLKSQLTSLFAKTGTEQSQAVPDALSAAAELPQVRGLDLQEPGFDYRAGLYSAPPTVAAAETTYTRLQDSLLLPQILHRMEEVLRLALTDGNDSKLAYETLRVYLQLHEKNKFNAADVKTWVLRDWEFSDSAAVFGVRASMLGHIDRLFSGARAVQSPFVRDEELVRSAREFLSTDSSTQRLYERAKTSMWHDAPEEFTLTRAVGPQAGIVFTRASGQPLDKGIPGLFTYDGYQQLFDKRLPDFVAEAEADDAWVMGKEGKEGKEAKTLSSGAVLQKKAAVSAGGTAYDPAYDPLTQDIRRQYLAEYAQLWAAYLDDVRAVTGTSIAFDLTVLRAFAAPDSPLARLARAVARETTLSRPLVIDPGADKSLLDKAQEQLRKKAGDLRKGFGVLPQERMERDLVDNQFAALREVVTGQADVRAGTQQAAQGKPALENIAGLVNQYYTLMVVTDTALSSGSLPPGGADVGANLKLEASKLPAPFKSVLTALADSGSAKITEGAAAILRIQAHTQFDRIVGMMAIQVSEPCKRSIEGRYPFAQSSQDVDIDAFTRIFAAGGAADDFFNKQLAPFVDTSVRPWRYKNPATASLLSPVEIVMAGVGSTPLSPGAARAPGTPTLLGELLAMLARHGPNPDAFAKMQAIRDTFFREPGSKKMAWKVDMKVAEIDPSIVELLTDVDGLTQRYVHGPVQIQTLSWPGPRGGAVAGITAMPRIRPDTSSMVANGAWALFRLMDKAKLTGSASQGKLLAEFNFDGRRVVLDLNSGDLPMPLNSDLLRGFSCPGSA